MLTLLITTTVVMAQTTTDTVKVVNLESVNITGTRADEKQPITNMIIRAAEIKEDYHGEEMTFILAKTPSITTQSDGGHEQGYTTFRLRGIDQTRLNFTLNGVPLNEPEDQGVYFSNYPMFANSINSIQIQRGVGTTANGTSSYGGSINFESNNGYIKSTDLNIGYGSYNTTMVSASHGTGLIVKDKLSFYGNASVFTTDGYKYHSGNQGYSFFFGGQYYGKKDRLKLTAFSGFSNNQMSWLAVSESDINKGPKNQL